MNVCCMDTVFILTFIVVAKGDFPNQQNSLRYQYLREARERIENEAFEVMLKKSRANRSPESRSSLPSSEVSDHPDVFLSYQWDHQHFVKRTFNALTRAGFSCWMDIYQIQAGDDLQVKIQEGIINSKVVIAFLTKKYFNSTNCKLEVNYAYEDEKPVIPLRLETFNRSIIPLGIFRTVFTQNLIYIDLTSLVNSKEAIEESKQFKDLVKSLKRFVDPQDQFLRCYTCYGYQVKETDSSQQIEEEDLDENCELTTNAKPESSLCPPAYNNTKSMCLQFSYSKMVSDPENNDKKLDFRLIGRACTNVSSDTSPNCKSQVLNKLINSANLSLPDEVYNQTSLYLSGTDMETTRARVCLSQQSFGNDEPLPLASTCTKLTAHVNALAVATSLTYLLTYLLYSNIIS